MRSRRLLVWCVILALVAVPAARFAWAASDGPAHHTGVKSSTGTKSPRTSPSGSRTVAIIPGVGILVPVLAPRRADPLPSLDRLTVVDPAVLFHPPRG